MVATPSHKITWACVVFTPSGGSRGMEQGLLGGETFILSLPNGDKHPELVKDGFSL
jgi:hypothetical protein